MLSLFTAVVFSGPCGVRAMQCQALGESVPSLVPSEHFPAVSPPEEECCAQV